MRLRPTQERAVQIRPRRSKLLFCYTTRAMARDQEYTAQEMCDALRAADGVVLQAARKLGCSAMTIYRYAKRYVTVKQAMQEARRNTYAEAQGYLVAMMRDRDHKDHKWAVDRILQTYGPSVPDGLDWAERERTEHSGEVNIDIKGVNFDD